MCKIKIRIVHIYNTSQPQYADKIVVHEFVVELSDLCDVIQQTKGFGFNGQFVTERFLNSKWIHTITGT